MHACAIAIALLAAWAMPTPAAAAARTGEPALPAVAAGCDTTSVARADGTVWTWGSNASGQLGNGSTTSTETPQQVLVGAGTPLTHVTAVAQGCSTGYALRADGAVFAWGSNEHGQLGVGSASGPSTCGTTPCSVYAVRVQTGTGPTYLDAVKAIAAGGSYAVALRADGSVWSWGRGDAGQLGNQSTAGPDLCSGVGCSLYAIRAQDGNDPSGFVSSVTSVAAGTATTVALKVDGTMLAWGDATNGATGSGATTGTTLAPTAVQEDVSGFPNAARVRAVDGSGRTFRALRSDGTVLTWGAGGQGQLGNATTTAAQARATSVLAPGGATPLDRVRSLGGGPDHAVAVRADGTVWAWGRNDWGQLGDTTQLQRTLPVQVADSATPTWLGLGMRVAAGSTHSVAVRADGTIWSWGDDQVGQLGLATAPAACTGGRPCTTYARQAQLAVGGGHRTVAAAEDTSYALAADGTVWAWGQNEDGQLGIGVEDGATSSPRRVLRAAGTPLDGIVAIAAGRTHALALRADGTVWAWGDNDHGQLARGSTSDSDWAIAMQAASGVTLTDIVDVAAIEDVTLALVVDGRARAAGRNRFGAIGDDTTSNRTYPVQVQQLGGAALDRVVSLSGQGGDADASMAVRDDGTLWAWGLNNHGQLGLGSASGPSTCNNEPCSRQARQVMRSSTTPLRGVTQGATSFRAGHALTASGHLLSWGSNRSAEVGNASSSTALVPYPVRVATNDTNSTWVELAVGVAAGDYTPLALLADGRSIGWGENNQGQVGDGTSISPRPFVSFTAGVGGTGQSSMVTAVENGADHGIVRDGSGRVLTWGSDRYGQLGACTSSYAERLHPEEVQWSCANRAPNHVYWTTQYKSDGTTYLPISGWTNETSIVIKANTSDPDDAQSLVLYVEIRPANQAFSSTCGDTTDPAIFASAASPSVTQGRAYWLATTVTGLTSGQHYHWRVCTKDGSGLVGPWYTPGGEPDISVDTSTPPTGTFGTRQVSARCSNTGAVLADGTVWMAGDGSLGQLGNGTTTGTSSTPVQVRVAPDGTSALTGVRSLAVGCGFAVAVRTDGTVWAWGRNDLSQLGATSATTCGATACSEYAVQVDPTNATQVKEVAAGTGFALALRADGRVLAWGDNANGRLGRGTVGGTSATAAPVRDTAGTGDLADVTSISAGDSFAVASDASGSVWSWGSNASDHLGAGLTTGSDYPTAQRVLTAPSTPIARVKRVEAGGEHALALRDDGTLWSWGANGSGQLGVNVDGGIGSYAGAVRDSAGTTMDRFLHVSAGGAHTLAVRADGTVWAWGANTSGQLSQNSYTGASCAATCEIVPVAIRDSTGTVLTVPASMFKGIAAGARHSVALGANAQAWTWGSHGSGELATTAAVGTCPSSEACAPALVQSSFSTGTGYVDVSGLGYGAAALRADGTVATWGHNGSGEFGNGTFGGQSPRIQTVEVTAGVPLTNVVAIASGAYSNYAVRADGTAWAWGAGWSGRLGNNSGSNRSRAVQVRSASDVANAGPALVDVVDIAGHDGGAFAADAGGRVWSWGGNSRGELGSGACCSSRSYAQPVLTAAGVELAGITAIGASSSDGDDGFAVRSDGTVWAWGQNEDGQMGRGTASGPDLCGTAACSLYAGQVREGSGLAPLTRVIATAAADDTGYAVKADGTVWSWGSGSSGRLGNNGTDDRHHAVQVRAASGAVDSGTPLTGAIALGASEGHGAALGADGRVMSWGSGWGGELGDGTWTSRSYAVPSKDDAGVALAGIRWLGYGGQDHGAALVDGTGRVRMTGGNYHYQQGDCVRAGRSHYMPLRDPCAGNLSPSVRWLNQYRNDHSTRIPGGGWTADGITNNVYLDFNFSDPDSSETVTPYLEFAPSGTAFSARCGDGTHPNVRTGTAVTFAGIGGGATASFTVTGLVTGTQYHWRACAVDGNGAPSPWIEFSRGSLPDFGVDNQPPANPTKVDDGPVRDVDITETTSLTVLEATWPAAIDGGGSGLVQYEYCISTTATGTDCGGGATRTWTNNGWPTELRATGLSLVHGTTYYVCVLARDGAGTPAVGHVCSNGQTARFAVTGVAPASAVQGAKGVAVTITGEGFLSTDTATILGDGVTVQSVTWVSSTRIDIVVDLALSATTGLRGVRVSHTGTDTSQATLASSFTVEAFAISISLSTLGYADTARDATSPHAIGWGLLMPGATREIGPAGSGQALAGAASEVTVVSNGAWRLQQSATDFSDGGTAVLAASEMAWKHAGVAEAWTPFSTSASTIEGAGGGKAANAPGGETIGYDWRLAVPATQLSGAYTATVTYTAIAAV